LYSISVTSIASDAILVSRVWTTISESLPKWEAVRGKPFRDGAIGRSFRNL